MHTRDDMFNDEIPESPFTFTVKCPGLSRAEDTLTEALTDGYACWVDKNFNPHRIEGCNEPPSKPYALKWVKDEFNKLIRRFIIERGVSYFNDLETFYGYCAIVSRFELIVNTPEKRYTHTPSDSVINEAVKTVIAIRESDEHI